MHGQCRGNKGSRELVKKPFLGTYASQSGRLRKDRCRSDMQIDVEHLLSDSPTVLLKS